MGDEAATLPGTRETERTKHRPQAQLPDTTERILGVLPESDLGPRGSTPAQQSLEARTLLFGEFHRTGKE